MYNYELDTSLLPQVWITWASTKNKQFDKRYWLNGQTGEKKTEAEKWMRFSNPETLSGWNGSNEQTTNVNTYYCNGPLPKIWVKSGTNMIYFYAKYHEDIEKLEMAAVQYDTSRTDGAHQWKYIGNRFFIDKNKNIESVREAGNSEYYVYKYHTGWRPIDVLRQLTRVRWSHTLLDEIKKLIGADYFTIGNGSRVDVVYPWHLTRWYETVQRKPSTGPKQKSINKLIEMPLSDISEVGKIYPPIVKMTEYGYPAYNLKNLLYFEQVNDEWSVLRWLNRSQDNTIYESWRIYISDKGKTVMMSRQSDHWIPSKQTRSQWGNQAYLANKTEAIEKCNIIKYILKSADVKDNEEVNFLITALRFPEIEQLCKLGGSSVALRITNSSYPKADLKRQFGYYNEKEKNILRKIGMTKLQFDFYMNKYKTNNYRYELERALPRLRDLFGNDLSYLDVKTFEKYLSAFLAIDSWQWCTLERNAETLSLDKLRFIKNVVRLTEKRSDVARVISDTLSSYIGLNIGTVPEVNWYFDDVSDAVRAHDAIVALKAEQDAERRALWDMQAAERRKKEEEKRKKVDKERKQYEYEDDKYIIRLPKDSTEIVNEGALQHICIGGYTSRHALGDTNLFFLRKKEEDRPFYAIEMNNAKSIVQIHGFGNKWLGNDPDAIPTVIRWLRKNGIKCDNKILTCTAKGYGGYGECVPMPVVD